MLNLLNIPTNYWTRYIYVDTTASSDTDQSQKVSSTSYFGKRSIQTINKYNNNEINILINGNQNSLSRNPNFTARKCNATQAILRNSTNTNIKTLNSVEKKEKKNSGHVINPKISVILI